MRNPAYAFVFILFLIACNDSRKKQVPEKDNKISLRTDSINVVTLSDTMVINESICRGCEFEGSVRFSIIDSLGIVTLEKILTDDDNKSDMAGGSIGKEVILTPVKPGITTIRLYKLLSDKTAREDSAGFKTYTIEVKN